ncbi:hypothetical protein [Methylocapsa acidiphila]|uniref:hypothetical protein n=1 Tax=Methylocapsa acidiphila TaxID=133552 RepID=UPI000419F2A7|nr:hypothetical protein [Methylocapsa acidiphila]
MAPRLHVSSLLFVTASCFALSGCYIPGVTPVGTADIAYQQVGACNGTGGTSNRPNEAYVIFKIETVDNAKGNVDFLFLPTRLFVDQSSEKEKATWIGGWKRQFVSEETKFLKDLGAPVVSTKSIPANGKASPNGFVFVAVGTKDPNGAAEANQTAYKLSYDTEPVEGQTDPKVVLTKTNASQTSWPATENCKDVKLQ